MKILFAILLLLSHFTYVAHSKELSAEENLKIENIRNGYNALLVYKKNNPNMTKSSLVELPLQEFIKFCFTKHDNIDIELFQYLFSELNKIDSSGNLACDLGYQLMQYCREHTIPPVEKKKILGFLLNNFFLLEENNMDVMILKTFPEKENYDIATQNIIKKKILGAKKIRRGSSLLFIDVAGLIKDRDIVSFLTTESKKCNKWEDNETPWFALLLLARNGNDDAIERVLNISKIVIPSFERKKQIFYMPAELSMVHDRRIADFLIELVNSDESMPSPGDPGKLNAVAAIALNSLIVNFPNLDYNQFNNSKEIELCKKWILNNKDYKLKMDRTIPQIILR